MGDGDHDNTLGLLASAHDVGLGGIAVAVAKMAVIGKLGFEGMVTLSDERDLFGESFSRAIIEVSSDKKEALENLLVLSGLNYECIGKVTDKDLMLNSISLSQNELNALYLGSFNALMQADI